jgi:hypothetical protein
METVGYHDNDKVFSTISVCSEWLVGYHDNDKVFSTITVCSEWLVGYHDNDKVFSNSLQTVIVEKTLSSSW